MGIAKKVESGAAAAAAVGVAALGVSEALATRGTKLTTTTTSVFQQAARSTVLSSPVKPGDTVLLVAQQSDFTVGEEVVLDAGTSKEEVNEIAQFGSIIL